MTRFGRYDGASDAPNAVPVTTVFVCGPDEVGFDECWNCVGPLYEVKKEFGKPLTDHNDRGRYCSVECVDEASERNLTGKTCTVCGGHEGHCRYREPDDPADDPHPFWPQCGDAPPEMDAWLARMKTRGLWSDPVKESV